MNTSIIALYDDFNQAERAIEDLLDNGLTRENISLVTNDSSEEYRRYVETLDLDEHGSVRHDDDSDDPDAGEGAGFGAVIGALTGLGIATIPGIGPVFALGPWAGALISGIGAGSGAATGGLTAGLVDLDSDDEQAQVYAEGVRRGGTLVVVQTMESDENRVESILHNHNPVDVEERETDYRKEDWTGFDDTKDKPYTADEVNEYRNRYASQTDHDELATQDRAAFEAYESEFRDHFQKNYSDKYSYDQYRPAYRYGYILAIDPSNQAHDWDYVEPEAHKRWEEQNSGTWDDARDAIRRAYVRTHERVAT